MDWWAWLGTTLAVPVGRFAVFMLLFVALALLEGRFAARGERDGGDRRLVANFGFGIGNAALAAAVPVGSLAAALLAESRGIGLFQIVHAPAWAMLAAFVAARSLANYGVHRASHFVPWLWRIHRVHHSDRLVDLSTGLRNHPAELLLALLVAAAVTLLVGPPVAVVAAAELILFGPALWTHANVRLPARLERPARWLIVTPAMHLVHHSAERGECDGNYGDLLPLWDHLFGSYRPPGPVARLGLGEAEDAAADSLWRQLGRPFRP
jgi:sterol desaturase/sphingolipid hydroxylase (fatty acid hydroxylase superfamily)